MFSHLNPQTKKYNVGRSAMQKRTCQITHLSKMEPSICRLLTYDKITHVLFGRIIPITNGTIRKTDNFSTENIKLVVVIFLNFSIQHSARHVIHIPASTQCRATIGPPAKCHDRRSKVKIKVTLCMLDKFHIFVIFIMYNLISRLF